MPYLKHLWKGHTHFIRLRYLAEIYVNNCASVKYLFPLSLAQNLSNLRLLDVQNCSALKLIFDDGIKSEGRPSTNSEVGHKIITLPLLKIMVLKDVGRFSSICPLDYVLSCQSFVQPTQVTIENCNTSEDCETEVDYSSSEDCETEVDYSSSEDSDTVFDYCFSEDCETEVDYSSSKDDYKIDVDVSSSEVCETRVDYCSSENCTTDVEYSDTSKRFLSLILPNITTLCQLVKLSELRHITVKNTVTLSKSLFPHHVAQALGCLEILEVDNCNEVENLIEPAGDEQLPYFPNLRGLILRHLSNSAYIWKGTMELINLSRLEYIRLYECDRLTSLFTSTLAKSLVKLEELQIKSCKALETIIVRDDKSCEASTGTQDSFKEMKIIGIQFCDNLKSVLPISFVAHGLPKLKSLTIAECDNLEQVFVDEEGIVAKTAIIEWKNLHSLVLWNLPKLVRLVPFNWHLKTISSSLSVIAISSKYKVKIQNCKTNDYSDKLGRYLRFILPNITTLLCQLVNFSQLRHITVKYLVALSNSKSLFPRNIAQALGSLETLGVSNCNELENLIEPARDQDSTQLHENNSATCFPCLMYLSVYKCEKLKTVFPLSVAQSLPKLSGITLSRARELEEIFTDDLNEEYVSGCNKLIKLPELTILRLRQLPRLSRMCPAGYALCCPNPPKDLIIDECSLTMDADKWFPPIYSENIRQCAIEWNTSQRMN